MLKSRRDLAFFLVVIAAATMAVLPLALLFAHTPSGRSWVAVESDVRAVSTTVFDALAHDLEVPARVGDDWVLREDEVHFLLDKPGWEYEKRTLNAALVRLGVVDLKVLLGPRFLHAYDVAGVPSPASGVDYETETAVLRLRLEDGAVVEAELAMSDGNMGGVVVRRRSPRDE